MVARLKRISEWERNVIILLGRFFQSWNSFLAWFIVQLIEAESDEPKKYVTENIDGGTKSDFRIL